VFCGAVVHAGILAKVIGGCRAKVPKRAQMLLVPLLNVVHVASGPYKLFSSISFSLALAA